MKKLAVVIFLLAALGLSLAQSGQGIAGTGISGTVFASTGGNLQNASVIACLLEKGECSESGSKFVQFSGGTSAKFTLSGLQKTGYVLLAWKDLNKNGEPDKGDDLAVYSKNGKAVWVVPPAQGIELRLAKFTGDLDAMLGGAGSSTTTPAPATPPASNAPVNQIQAGQPAITLNTNGWTDNQDGSYSLEFDKDPNNPSGFLNLVLLPSRAKQGNLIAQAQSIWKEQTQGKFDVAGKDNARFVRRLLGGINAAVMFGSLQSMDLENGTTFENKKFFISALVLAETNNLVTPIFILATRNGSNGYSGIEKAWGIMETLVQSIRPIGAVKVSDLYTAADLAGKWTNRSGTYQSGNFVNPATGNVVGSGSTQTAFTMKLEFRRDGTGNYYASLLTNNTGSINTNTENEAMRWKISGDRLTLERPKSGRTSIYVLYGTGRDGNNQPIILAKYMIGDFKGEFFTFPDETWSVDK